VAKRREPLHPVYAAVRRSQAGWPGLYFRRRISSGNKSSNETRRTEASNANSRSVTQRNRASMCESVPRLTSSPASWHCVANSSWVKPRRFRKSLTCGPITFAGALAMPNSELDPILKIRFYCYEFIANPGKFIEPNQPGAILLNDVGIFLSMHARRATCVKTFTGLWPEIF
jgi:hypothetical protein